MMRLIQFSVMLATIWAHIYYGLTDNGYLIGIVALFAAFAVTALIVEIRLLPSRLARIRDRLFGLKDQPGDEITSLPRPLGHRRDTLQDFTRPRIGQDRR